MIVLRAKNINPIEEARASPFEWIITKMTAKPLWCMPKSLLIYHYYTYTILSTHRWLSDWGITICVYVRLIMIICAAGVVCCACCGRLACDDVWPVEESRLIYAQLIKVIRPAGHTSHRAASCASYTRYRVLWCMYAINNNVRARVPMRFLADQRHVI